MKQFIFSAVMILIAVSAYSYGQANGGKHVKPCCCEHTQQIAEDIHAIRTMFSKPYKAPPDIELTDPGTPTPGKLSPLKPAKPNYAR